MIEAAAASQIGQAHRVNEDSYLVDEAAGLFVVCDGMGGQKAGEVAASLSIEFVKSFVHQSRETDEITWPFGIDPGLSCNANRLLTAVKIANRRVWKKADEESEYIGMGSTIVAAIVDDSVATVCWAGDSRCYLARGGTLEQLTQDDSWVQVAAAEGLMSAEALRTHPMRNVITKAVGAEENLDPHLLEIDLEDGDLLLLCTDGLYKTIPDESIPGFLQKAESGLEPMVGDLVEAAVKAGADDDVTIVALTHRAT